ncbi:MAG: TIGR00159 family protein [Blastochloris sp.]|nr:TIGR00159 family protein [Blastochloris sp.]
MEVVVGIGHHYGGLDLHLSPVSRHPGARVLLGLLFFFGSLFFITRLFDLTLLAFVLQASSAFLVISLVVVFQPEIRRVLADLGGAFDGAKESDRRFVIEHVIQALDHLRGRKFGALIAIERSMTHPQVRESGVLVDALISEDLLSCIFHDKSPLHDGGVILAHDRVAAAGCLFPITQRQDLPRTLGLRHRAALGFVEDSDVVVVVLSEETGEISLCCQKAMERPLSLDELRLRLTEELSGKGKKVRNLPFGRFFGRRMA